MFGAANVSSFRAVEEFRAFARGVEPRVTATLLAMELEVARLAEVVALRASGCRRKVADCRREVERAKAELARCRAMRGPNGMPPNCSRQEQELASAQAQLRSAELRLLHVERQQRRLAEAVNTYHSRARPIADWLRHDHARAGGLLDRAIASLHAYAGVPLPPHGAHPAPIADSLPAALTGPLADLDDLLRAMKRRWQGLLLYWNDPVRHRFEADHWSPLTAKLTELLAEMVRLADTMRAVERETRWQE
jgi:hypothetical protein